MAEEAAAVAEVPQETQAQPQEQQASLADIFAQASDRKPIVPGVPEDQAKAQTEPPPPVTPEPTKEEPKAEEKPSAEVKEVAPPSDFEKRYKDTQSWANKVNQENLELKRNLGILSQQLEVVNKKLDGTYDPEKDEPKLPPVEDIVRYAQSEALFKGRLDSSRAAAFQVHTPEKVEKMLWADDAPLREIQDNPMVKFRIENSPSPVMEAMDVVKEYMWYKQWGYKPEDIETNIRNDERKKAEEAAMKKLSGNLDLRDRMPSTLGNVKGAAHGGQTPDQVPSLTQIFGR
jgi:hypothetical protein